MSEIDEQLKGLIIKRGQLKARLTRLNTFFTSTTLNSDNIIELKLRLAKFEPCWDEFQGIQDSIETFDDNVEQLNERDQFENNYFRLISQIEAAIPKHEVESGNCNSNNASFSGNNSNCNSVSLKLPTLSLPEFDGSYDKWLPFYDMFNSVVHIKNNLSDIEKLHYLKSSLKGEAFSLISSLTTVARNYQIAWNLLIEGYQNNRLIIQTHVKALFELPVISKESHKELRNLLNSFSRHIRSLEALGEPINTWDTILVCLLSAKIDPITKREWELSLKRDVMPTVSEFETFLSDRCLMLESMSSGITNSRNKTKFNSCVTTSNQRNNVSVTCPKCKSQHSLYQCELFLKQDIQSRISDAKSLKLCLNCLRAGHSVNYWNSRSCKYCKKRHNSLLHSDGASANSSSTNGNSSYQKNSQNSSDTKDIIISNLCSNTKNHSIILLATALVEIHSSAGNVLTFRALLDSGSQASFITKRVAKQLNLKLENVNISVTGINNRHSKIGKQASATVKARLNNYNIKTKFFVLPYLVENSQSTSLQRDSLEIPTNLQLADPNFLDSGSIDILLGAEVFWDLILPEQFKSSNNLYFQNTKLGWVVSGRLLTSPSNDLNLNTFVCAFTTNLELQFQRFCDLEQIPDANNMTLEEKACEQNYLENVTRDQSGRFVVKLPLKQNANHLGDSFEAAYRRFQILEKRLYKQPQLLVEYSNFIHEYLSLGHMELIPPDQVNNAPNFYLPHHAVIKSTSVTTKLRVVFDASAKSSTGVSLNDILMVGPTIQEDLFSIVIRWRGHKFVLMADIEKMYRQVKVATEDSDLQRIIWRDRPDLPVNTYRLTTVTYGTACGSYLAIRSLHELAHNAEPKLHKAANVVLRDFYVDDLMTGANSIPEALEIRDQLIELLDSGGFKLRKWASNDTNLLTDFHVSSDESHALAVKNEDSLKMLGLLWNSGSDQLHYSVADMSTSNIITKRFILAKISQFFDPLGLLGPCIIKAKLFIQKLWQLNVGWDDPIPEDVLNEWHQYVAEAAHISNISIPRYVIGCSNINHVQLHAFCDASEKAYGACIYIRSTSSDDNHFSRLLCAKSRVAPLKVISLPRLELCGALLAAKLVSAVTKALTMNFSNIFCWTDSKIVLAWIQSASSQWKTFVGNRVSKIQDLTKISDWNHVSSHSNPADLLSRGVNPLKLSAASLWWHGPDWLTKNKSAWPHNSAFSSFTDVPEKRKLISCPNTINSEFNLFSKYSKLQKLVYVTAYSLRFIKNSKLKDKNLRQIGFISSIEYIEALTNLIRICQTQEFMVEINGLTRSNCVLKKSKIFNLDPFIDNNGILRVGGRLKNAPISFAQKHPIILPANHSLTTLIVQNEHIVHLHAGPQTLLAAVRLKYWPLNAKRLVKKIFKNCLLCFKNRPRNLQPFMGNLPVPRVSFTRAFTNVGIDYAGPFSMKEGIRSKIVTKSYLVIFICLSVKAVHFEIVTSLTSECFLATLKRFISRRGTCSSIYSDNATNFKAANKELKTLAESFMNQDFVRDITPFLSEFSISWNFIPARSPSFGGLWEAAVKSAKYHLKRIVSNTPLTFEQLYTVVTQVESILNSRPITSLPEDPSDMSVLTPGHFLIGDSLRAIPEPELVSIPVNRLSKWQHLQQMIQHFWTRWSKEYLHNLQTRVKWNDKNTRSIQLNQLVLLKENNLPPTQWPCGRIVKLCPGNDGIVRVVQVKLKAI